MACHFIEEKNIKAEPFLDIKEKKTGIHVSDVFGTAKVDIESGGNVKITGATLIR